MRMNGWIRTDMNPPRKLFLPLPLPTITFKHAQVYSFVIERNQISLTTSILGEYEFLKSAVGCIADKQVPIAVEAETKW